MGSMEVYDSQGNMLTLGGMLGTGGEGSIYSIPGMHGYAAKLFHKTADNQKADKLLSMVRMKNQRLLGISAWPSETLHSSDGGPVTGVIMPWFSGFKEIHKLYSPRSRIIEFPYACWDFLVHAAANLARAFSVIHEYGHVVGDINHGNILVSPKAVVRLIDCDSYQVQSGGRCYPCDVGVSIYQPPEIQDLESYGGVIRTVNHDNFGLAVLIFQLLFMGRHPFSGLYEGPGEMSIEKAIRECRFAYRLIPDDQIKQPPNTPGLDSVSHYTAELFERAFLSDVRPSAKEWASGLAAMCTQIKKCGQEYSHRYFGGLSACPWCTIEESTGAVLFNPGAGLYRQSGRDIEELQQEGALIIPPEAPSMQKGRRFSFLPSWKYIKSGRLGKTAMAVLGAGIICAAAAISGIPAIYCAAAPLMALAAAAPWFMKPAPEMVKREAVQEYEKAYEALEECRNKWDRRNWEEAYEEKKANLSELFERHRSIEDVRTRELKAIHTDGKKMQLSRFLRRYRLSGTNTRGITSRNKEMLKAHGIRTAADIDREKIAAVQGIGPETARELMKWRSSLEKRFVFDSGRAPARDMVEEIEREFIKEKSRITKALSDSLEELLKISEAAQAERESLQSEIKLISGAMERADSNLWAVGCKSGFHKQGEA
jgi:DNA-binding helix-hairpin-helix protein with protein kinase domain